MEGVTCLRLPTHPNYPRPLFPLAQPLIHAIPHITVAVNKVVQNPAVLAS